MGRSETTAPTRTSRAEGSLAASGLAVFLAAALLLATALACGEPEGEQLVMLSPSGQVSLVDEDGAEIERFRADQRNGATVIDSPVWSPDGARLAFWSVGRDGYAVWLREGDDNRLLYRTPFEPIYMIWSPAGDRIALIEPNVPAGGVRMVMLPLDGAPSEMLEAPAIYVSWSADGSRLAYRASLASDDSAGTSVGILDAGGARPLASHVTLFHVPGWCPCGDLVAVGEAQGGDRLWVRDLRGDRRLVGELEGRSVFSWSPDGQRLAYATTSHPAGILYNHLRVYDLATGKTDTLLEGDLLAFYWSPDSSELAVVTYDDERYSLALNLVSEEGAQELAIFKPTPEQYRQFLYFDQYALSLRFWSRDGRSIAFAGSVPGVADGQGFVVDVRTAELTQLGPAASVAWR